MSMCVPFCDDNDDKDAEDGKLGKEFAESDDDEEEKDDTGVNDDEDARCEYAAGTSPLNTD